MDYIYVRVSSDKQDSENQLKMLREKYPDAKNNIVSETMSSLKKRPKLKKLLALLKKGDRLIVWKLDRIGRSMVELMNTIDDLTERKIQFISEMESVDVSTPTGKFHLAAIAWAAEMERDSISERTKLGLVVARAKRDSGKKVWKSRIHSKGGPRPLPRDPEMIIRLKELRDSGKSWKAVVEKLAYESAEWKVGASLASKLYFRGDRSPKERLFDV